MIDDLLPSTNLREDILHVHLGRIGKRDCEFKQPQLSLKFLHKESVLNVVLDELREVVLVEVGEVLMLDICNLGLTKFNLRDMSQLVGLAGYICELFVEIVVVEGVDANHLVGDAFPAVDLDLALLQLPPRRQLLGK